VNLDFDIGTGSHGTVDGSATVSGYNQGFYYSLHGDSHHTRGISALSDREFLYKGRNGAQYRPSFLVTNSTEITLLLVLDLMMAKKV